jgi:glc operon protein GlcG
MYVAAAKRLTHDGAKRMAAVAVERARDAGIAISVAIADAGGHLVVLERMDGGRFHTVHSSSTKAVCAASNRRPTSARGAQGQPLDVAHAIGLALAAGPQRSAARKMSWQRSPGPRSIRLPSSPLPQWAERRPLERWLTEPETTEQRLARRASAA